MDRKSQIALEYAFRLEESSETSIFSVYTSAGINFEEAYRRIASQCNIPGQDDPQSNSLLLVKNWLGQIYPLKWLMIIDNVDSAQTFFKEKIYGKPLI